MSKRLLVKDFCKPFLLDPDNKELVSFDSQGYAKAANVYIDQLEKEKQELIKALSDILDQDKKDLNGYIKDEHSARKLLTQLSK
jgi:hypothetical protein